MPNTKNVPPMKPETTITKANLLAALAESLVEMFGHVGAWQRFGAEVTGYLRSKGLSEDFAAYQAKQKQKPKQRRGAND